MGNDGTLNGIEIYGITEDHTHLIWLTTSNGLYQFDGSGFNHYKNEDFATNEFFQPVVTESNQLFFSDIKGNLFTLAGDNIVSVRDNDFTHFSVFTSMFSSGNYIYMFSTDSLYQVDTNGIAKAVFGYPNAFQGTSFKWNNPVTNTSFYSSNFREIIRLNNGEFSVSKGPKNVAPEHLGNTTLQYISDGKPFLVSQKMPGEAINFHITNINKLPSPNRTSRLEHWFLDSDGNSWIKYTFSKGLFFGKRGKEAEVHIFKDYQINFFFEDKNGTIWLGTRDNGILVVQDLNDFNISLEDEIIGLEGNSENVIAYSRSNVYSFNPDEMTDYRVFPGEPGVSHIYLIKNPKLPNSYFVQTEKGVSYVERGEEVRSFPTRNSLIKKHRWYGDTAVFFATISGALKALPFTDQPGINLGSIGYFGIRCSDVLFLPNEDQYLIASFNGIFRTDKNGEFPMAVQFNGKQLNAQYLETAYGMAYAITSSGTVYSINPKNWEVELMLKLPISYLINTEIKDSILHVVGKQSIKSINLNTHAVSSTFIGKVSDFKITGAELIDNNFWLSTNDGIIRYSMVNKTERLDSSLFDLEAFDRKNSRLSVNQNTLKYQDNYVKFRLRNRDYRFLGKTEFLYQLVGTDDSLYRVSAENNEIEFKSLRPGEYNFRVRAQTVDGASSAWKEYYFIVRSPFYQKWWFVVGSVALLVSLSLAWYDRRYQRIRSKELLQKRVQESELNALKAQMNPHFIFNCLNSIQDLILKGDSRASNKYLGSFSELVRKTMEDSSKQEISLSRELDMLKIYLNLENMRFKDLTYEIIHPFTDEELEYTKIPPMLIQPYIENALKHGLMHSDQDRKLELNISRVKNDLQFSVKDNGIGLEEAKTIKKRQAKYGSFSGGVMAKRVEILNNEGRFKIKLQTLDLINEKENPWSTMVSLVFWDYFSTYKTAKQINEEN